MSQYLEEGGKKGADVARKMQLHRKPYHLSVRNTEC